MELNRFELIILKRGLLEIEALPSSQDTGMSQEFKDLKGKISNAIIEEEKKNRI